MILNKRVADIQKKYGEGIILFHTIGTNYECLANDATIVNKECGVELERDGGTKYCWVKPCGLESVISTLSNKGHKIAVLNHNDVRVVLPTA